MEINYEEFRRLHIVRREPYTILFCGSFAELPLLYVISNPTDIDVMYCYVEAYAVENSEFFSHKSKALLVIEKADCNAGFVRLRINHRNHNPYFRRSCVTDDDCPSLPAIIPLDDLQFLNIFHGLWGELKQLKIDQVYAIFCPSWPTEATEWISRDRRISGWPPEDIVLDIIRSGCHLVAKPHPLTTNDDTQWRYSFSKAEVILIHTWTDAQKYIYHLLRLVKKEIVKECGGEDCTPICNYHVKTLMFWACEERPAEFWEDGQIEKSVRQLLCQMCEWLIEKCCRNYFLSAYNMMDHLQDEVDLSKEILLLLSFDEQRISSLMVRETKAYHTKPFILRIPNEILYQLPIRFYNEELDRFKRLSGKSLINVLCTSKHYLPELRDLHHGIMKQVQLSKSSVSQKNSNSEDAIAFAIKHFDLAVQSHNYGVSPVLLSLRCSSVDAFLQQAVLSLCTDHHLEDPTQSTFQVSKRTLTCCYVRDQIHYSGLSTLDIIVKALHNFCLGEIVLKNTLGCLPVMFKIFQAIFIKAEGEIPKPTYIVSVAYRANFYYAALSNYRLALNQCLEALERIERWTGCYCLLAIDTFPFLLTNDISAIFDRYIQTVLGFLTLRKAIKAQSKATYQGLVLHLYADDFLRYISIQCSYILRKKIEDFHCHVMRLRCEEKYGFLFRRNLSRLLLETAICINEREHPR